MSTYYYFQSCNEYVELTSGGWYSYMEDLAEVLQSCIRNGATFGEFLSALRKQDTFTGFCDNGDYLTPRNIKYFLQPLYHWAHKHPNFMLISDCEQYDMAVQRLCKDKGIEYQGSYNMEVQELLDSNDCIVDKYFAKVLSIFTDDTIINEIGADFALALNELKAGAKIHRKAEPDTEYWLKGGKLCWTYGTEPEPMFGSDDVLAEDWEYGKK